MNDIVSFMPSTTSMNQWTDIVFYRRVLKSKLEQSCFLLSYLAPNLKCLIDIDSRVGKKEIPWFKASLQLMFIYLMHISDALSCHRIFHTNRVPPTGIQFPDVNQLKT